MFISTMMMKDVYKRQPFEGESLSDLLAEAVQNLHAEYADYEIEELEGEEEDKSCLLYTSRCV